MRCQLKHAYMGLICFYRTLCNYFHPLKFPLHKTLGNVYFECSINGCNWHFQSLFGNPYDATPIYRRDHEALACTKFSYLRGFYDWIKSLDNHSLSHREMIMNVYFLKPCLFRFLHKLTIFKSIMWLFWNDFPIGLNEILWNKM